MGTEAGRFGFDVNMPILLSKLCQHSSSSKRTVDINIGEVHEVEDGILDA